MGENVRELEDAVIFVKRWEDIIKTQKKRIICLVAKQGQIFKKFQELAKIFWDIGSQISSLF